MNNHLHPDIPHIKKYLLETVGDEGYSLAKFIHEKQPVTIEEIQEAHGGNPSELRKKLYLLESAHAAEYQVETGPKGWQTFIWNTNLYNIEFLLEKKREAEMRALEKKLEVAQSGLFFECTNCSIRETFDGAYGHDFACPVCGKLMQQSDSGKYIERLRKRISELV
ncbi:MAG: hypothetical protein CVT48_00175 [Thermoplasmata archaeon HGW-Thermoplasmata-1]|nr:MAG: hypothetical protein CVT48_00175 [Thermoplasmata archaeon HGW-Thermoplasmata-1]